MRKKEIVVGITEFIRHSGKYLNLIPKAGKVIFLKWGKPYMIGTYIKPEKVIQAIKSKF